MPEACLSWLKEVIGTYFFPFRLQPLVYGHRADFVLHVAYYTYAHGFGHHVEVEAAVSSGSRLLCGVRVVWIMMMMKTLLQPDSRDCLSIFTVLYRCLKHSLCRHLYGV